MINNTFKVAIYLRLSREDEKLGESASITNQRQLILNYINDNNLVLVKEYVDDGVSGTTFNRTGFNQMIKDCEAKKINMIITKDTSRLGRDHIEFGYYVEKYFPEHNIRYVAINDGIDTFTNNSSNDMLVFKSAFNDMYVKDISNKLRSSLYIKKKNGQFVGAYAPYGYTKDIEDKHKLVIKEKEAIIVKRIFDMFINGYSINKISEILTNDNIPTPSISKNMNIGQINYHQGIWSTRTINDILKNPTYIGNLTQCRQKKINYKSKKRIHNTKDEWIIKEDAMPPIIDKKVFSLAQNMFKCNKNKSTTNTITSNLLLKGLIYCKECNHTIGFRCQKQTNKNNDSIVRIYGNCNYWIKRKKENVCTPHSINYNIVEELIINKVKDLLNNKIDKNQIKILANNLANKYINIDNDKKTINRIDNEINILNNKIDNCYNDRLDNIISLEMFNRINNNLLDKIDELKIEKENILKSQNNIDDIKLTNIINNNIKTILDLKYNPQSLLSSLIDKIQIDENKNIDIYFKFK